MRGMRRFLRSRTSRQGGFTMAELLVTMVLLSIVGTMMVTTVTIISGTVVREQATGESLDIARVGMNRMTKAIRAGTEIPVSGSSNLPAFASIGPTTMTVYASLGAAPTKIQYSINATRDLIETQWPADTSNAPYWTFGTTPRVEIIASKIPAGATLFVYNDANGAPVSPQTTTDTTVLSLVRSVDITAIVNANPAKGADVTISSTVVLPNLGVVKR